MAQSVLDAIKQGQWDYEPQELPTPTAPTDALPGSTQKLEILAQRLKSGQPLWHPRDRICFDDGE